MNPFDPDDYPLRPTVRRLSRLWWGERRLVLLGLVCALAYTSLTLAVSVPENEWKKALQTRLRPAPKAAEPPRPQVVVTDSTGSTVNLSLPGKR